MIDPDEGLESRRQAAAEALLKAQAVAQAKTEAEARARDEYERLNAEEGKRLRLEEQRRQARVTRLLQAGTRPRFQIPVHRSARRKMAKINGRRKK
jgi:hypothetical protein